jgi:hypothetical protein
VTRAEIKKAAKALQVGEKAVAWFEDWEDHGSELKVAGIVKPAPKGKVGIGAWVLPVKALFFLEVL